MKIAIIGPESSGKTTLANALANKLNAVLVEEFARTYLEQKGEKYTYTIDDLILIAKTQFSNLTKVYTNETIIIDTEMLVMKIWAMDKFGNCPKEIEEMFLHQAIDLYILCKPDIPWQFDPLREDEYRRDDIYKMYLNALTKNNLPYLCTYSSLDERMNQIKNYLRELNLLK